MTMREAAKLTLLVSVKSLLLSLQRLVILTTSRHSHGGPTLPCPIKATFVVLLQCCSLVEKIFNRDENLLK
jgi:hypothetical protein